MSYKSMRDCNVHLLSMKFKDFELKNEPDYEKNFVSFVRVADEQRNTIISYRLESDNVRDLWEVSYRICRFNIKRQNDASYVTFRVRERFGLYDFKKYKRVRYRKDGTVEYSRD